MEPTPEEQRIMAAADWAAQNHRFRKRFPAAIGGFLFLCLLAAVSAGGAERLLFGGMALCVAAIAAPVWAAGNPLLEGPAKVFKFLAGLAIFVGGLGLTGVGLYLIKAGSFGILAGMVFVPLGLTGIAMGWTTLMAKVSNES